MIINTLKLFYLRKNLLYLSYKNENLYNIKQDIQDKTLITSKLLIIMIVMIKY